MKAEVQQPKCNIKYEIWECSIQQLIVLDFNLHHHMVHSTRQFNVLYTHWYIPQLQLRQIIWSVNLPTKWNEVNLHQMGSSTTWFVQIKSISLCSCLLDLNFGGHSTMTQEMSKLGVVNGWLFSVCWPPALFNRLFNFSLLICKQKNENSYK